MTVVNKQCQLKEEPDTLSSAIQVMLLVFAMFC